MEYNKANIRTWSMLGQRRAYGAILDQVAANRDNLIAVTSDTSSSGGLDRFKRSYPEKHVNVGIAEQDMMGVSAGLADSGFVVFASTFAKFSALRASEFVAHFMGYMQSPVILVGLGSGFAFEYSGTTHFGLEDLAAIRAFSNISIISPADGLSLAKSINMLIDYHKPAYLRLTGVSNNPIVYSSDFDFEIGKAVTLKEGADLAIISTGSMVHYSLKAAEMLEKSGIFCTVIDMHTIKPLDMEAISGQLNKKLIVTVEEHSVIGGLGGAVAETLAELKHKPPQLIIGIAQGYPRAGSYEYLLNQAGLTASKIAERIQMKLEELL